jgi:hypothetical protein
LFAVWAGVPADDIITCARHGEFGGYDKYRQEAFGVADHEHRWKRMEPILRVPPFVLSISINNDVYDNDEAKKYFKDLYSLSQLMLRRSGIDV